MPPAAGTGTQLLAEHGQHIFIYGHVRTNQIVYSLTRTLNNNDALKQLPFLGKQTKPAVLRKDFWRPLATVSFPNGHQGLKAYRELREFRKRHEHEWIPEEIPGRSLKMKGRALRDQKANSIADLAAVLLHQDAAAKRYKSKKDEEDQLAEAAIAKAKQELIEAKAERASFRKRMDTEEGKAKYKQLKLRKMKLTRMLSMPEPYYALAGKYHIANDARPPAKKGLGRYRGAPARPAPTLDGVKIEWANTLDAEFAHTWPHDVIHSPMERGDNRTRHMPPAPKSVSERAPKQIEADGIERQEAMPPVPTEAEPEIPEEPPTRMRRILDRLKYGAR